MALKNSRKYETLYSCACTIDKIAAHLSYDEFVEADSYVRMRNARGERGGLFRSSDKAREIRKRYFNIKDQAETACFPMGNKPIVASTDNGAEKGAEDKTGE